MLRSFARRISTLCVILLSTPLAGLFADDVAANVKEQARWPQNVVVTVGDIRTRIDGPKLWTLSGIDYRKVVMATEDSAYGTVVTIRNVGHLGTAHFLDVPGKPGQVEKENVTQLQLFVNDQPVKDFSPVMNLEGDSFRMERKSKIRALDLESTVTIRDGVLTETAQFRVNEPMDLQSAYPWMYALNANSTDYVIGDDKGIQRRGVFLKAGKAKSEVVKNAKWVAVFNPESGQGTVCCFLKHPSDAEGSFLLVDAPGSYRKVAAYTLENRIVPKGFDGTFQSAVGFFIATATDWEEKAQIRAAELRNSQQKP